MLCDFGVAAVVIWADRRFRLGHGRAFGLYVALYTAGRLWIEALRVDSANHILGLRLNIWTALIVGAVATAATLLSARRHRGREQSLLRAGAAEADVAGLARQADAPDDDTESRGPRSSAIEGAEAEYNGGKSP